MFGHEQMMQALNLTAAQKQQSKTIFDDARQKAEPIRQEMRQNREALHEAVKANNTVANRTAFLAPGRTAGKGVGHPVWSNGKVLRHSDSGATHKGGRDALSDAAAYEGKDA